MNKKTWLTISEALMQYNVSDSTLRRYINEYKKDVSKVDKHKNKYLLNSLELDKTYSIKVNYSKTTQEDKYKTIEHQKGFAELSLKQQENNTLNKLIEAQQKPFYKLSVLWVTIGFIILIVFLLGAGWLYRAELLSNNKTKISAITENSQKEIKTLSSTYENEVRSLNTQLLDTKKSYSDLITEIKISHSKLTDNQTETISKKEKEIERLQKELERVNRQSEIIKNGSN